MSSTSDVLILALGVGLAAAYLFRDQLFAASKPKSAPLVTPKGQNGSGNPRDFIAKMKEGKKRLVIFYGSQTGTAEEYAIRLAKEAKTKFGLASLVCDPEEYDFENLDQLPEDCAAFFVMATYGEGEPTDNAVQLLQNLQDESFEFSGGERKLEGLKYVVFGLGNKTYEHYNSIGRAVDAELTKIGAVRIGERGEGDDDKSMEEDYLEWKDGMWEAFATALGVEEGQGGDSADFAVSELDSHPPEKVYLGELSARALTKTKGIHDAKNPYPAPIGESKELFQDPTARNCAHIELNTEGSGITYQHGDHVGVWPSNPDVEVDRLLCTLGLMDKKDNVIGIESLDPALAKVPFPVPTTYATVLRHYIDISAVAGRQILGALSKFAPNPQAEEFMKNLNTNKEEYHTVVALGCLKLGEVLQLAAGNDSTIHPTTANTAAWPIPFDIIVSSIPRLQPRYYSISSSPKLYPHSIHVTVVVLKYENVPSAHVNQKWVYGVGSNFLLNLRYASNGETPPLIATGNDASVLVPSYQIEGPRSAYKDGTVYKAPIHVRRSTFRLPTNPKSPVIMIGPGTGVAPFRGFIQERVALARRSIEKNGPDALADWGRISLFYGCRKSTEDFLYAEEWPKYAEELKDKFTMHCAFSRENYKPDGSKIYVQDLLWNDREHVADAILQGKGYVYICGEAKNMSKQVEDVLARILGEAKGGSAAVEGVAEVKLLKERDPETASSSSKAPSLDFVPKPTEKPLEKQPSPLSQYVPEPVSSSSKPPSLDFEQKPIEKPLEKQPLPLSQIDLEELKQRLRSWRHQAAVLFRTRADDFTARSKVTFSQLGSELNRVTGYEVIDALKREVVEQEARINATRQATRQAKKTHDEAVAQRAKSQHEVNDLLERKSQWTDSDVSRFTTIVRQDHLYEQEEARAKAAVNEMEDAVEKEFSELMRAILARYHEEQVWSDKIRSASTYGSLAALGLNMLVFVMAILVVEPWKRRRLAQTFEKKIEELSRDNEAKLSATMAEIGGQLADQERLILHLRDISQSLVAPKSIEEAKQVVVVAKVDQSEEVRADQVVSTFHVTRGTVELAAAATGAFVVGVIGSLLISRS
ncbi:hypothetical protein C0991_003328 [Blastosporella zonata]|nr:hypothetical protein C0991_003328 [Blastosporella zonata]